MTIMIRIVLLCSIVVFRFHFMSLSYTNTVNAFQVSSTTSISSLSHVRSFHSIILLQQQHQQLSSSNVKTTYTQLSMVRRGKGSIGKEVVGTDNTDDSGSGGSGGMGMNSGSTGSSSTSNNLNWTPIPVSTSILPKEDNKVTLIDTNLITLKNGQTNPTGAVSVIQYQKQTYCFEVNCPSCKIPLLKAKCIIIPPNTDTEMNNSNVPLLQCDLCKATYNIKTGEKVTSVDTNQNIGIMGTIVKSIFSSKASGPLKVYKLGEKNGKLLIAGLD